MVAMKMVNILQKRLKKVKSISAKEFIAEMNSLKKRNIYDVRSEDEFKIGHFGAKTPL